ncbi:MAG: HU family DNA-binding protein [Gloeomargaritaceae cyanobacterium C42_A2020_066]|nr:HU family DNA-binding protein [Gloeomargaritaceae cyanobacterium C42_A2020_066]
MSEDRQSVNKEQLVSIAASKSGATKKSTEEVLNAVIEAITEAVAEDKKVTLVGFGSFEAKVRKEREGRNPGTGEIIHIPAKKVPSFTPGKDFRKRVDPNEA